MPIVVVTHNSTVGASIGADYLLFAGYPTDKFLKCIDGTVIKSHDTLMNSLEAGADTYEMRRQGYEAVKDQ
jgi:hypothetical protein